MATVLLAGCGDLGCEIARQLVTAGHVVTGLQRSKRELPPGVKSMQGDVTQASTLQNLADAHAEILIYCISADEHSDEGYRASYVDGLRNVLNAVTAANELRHVFFISSTGVYGQQSNALLDETTLPIPADFTGTRMLEAENLLTSLPCPSTALRLSGIYGPGRNRMIRQARDPHSWPASNRWTNRIHRDDAARFTAFLVQRLLQGESLQACYLVTDSCPVSQYDVLLWLAKQLDVDTSAVQVPDIAGAKRLSNARMLQTGFDLQYPDYKSGYSALLASDS